MNVIKMLSLVNMKIIEIEILLIVALNTITLDDFSIDSKTLIQKLIKENPDNYDLDIMYRIMAQIMTKLPKDLKERVTGTHKLQLFQQIAQSINIDNKLLEQFASVDPSLNNALNNTPISMELDEGDYNTLNKKYLNELKNYEESKGYISADSMEYADIANKKIYSNPNMNTKAKYIDNNPNFMLGQNDNTLYYFDSSSGALTEMPLYGKQTPVSLKDLKTILTSDKVNKNEIQGLIDNLKIQPTASATSSPTILSTDPSVITQPKNFFDTIGAFFTSGSRFQATGTSTPTLSSVSATPSATPSLPMNITSNAKDVELPIPPQYILNSVKGESRDEDRRDSKENNGPDAIISRDITTYRNNYKKINHDTKRIIERQVNPDSNSHDSTKFYYSKNNNNLEKRLKSRESTYVPIFTQHSSSRNKSFMNRTNANDIYPNKPKPESFTNMNEETFLNKMKNENKQIENVALSFVTILILVFLLVIFNSIRNN
jgi:hypothetical protein